MKRRFHIAVTLVLTGTTTAFCASASDAIVSEQSVQSLANTIEAANRTNDTEKSNSYLATDCVFHATYPGSDGSLKNETMTRQQYIDDQAKAKADGSNEVYKSTTPVVTVKDGRASATLQVTDSQIDGGKSVTTVSDQTETFANRSGQLMVTAVDVTVVSVTVDGKRVF